MTITFPEKIDMAVDAAVDVTANTINARAKCVVIAAVNEEASRIVLLMRGSGPSHLIGKAMFPGSYIEHTDHSPEAASRRALFEEIGVEAPIESFKIVRFHVNEQRELHTVFICCNINNARNIADGVVFTMDIDILRRGLKSPHAWFYAPGLAECLQTLSPYIASIRGLPIGESSNMRFSQDAQWDSYWEGAQTKIYNIHTGRWGTKQSH